MFFKLLSKKTPLAWRQLMKKKTRLAVAIAGIGFADMLMFLQMGLLDSLFDSATQPHRNLQADLVMVDSFYQSITTLNSFRKDRLQKVLGYEGVSSISPLYVGSGSWRNPETLKSRDILIFGIDPDKPAFNFPSVLQNLERLKLLNRVLFDKASRPEYGQIPDLLQQHGTVEVQLKEQVVQTVGLFKLGASFGADGNVITSDSTFLKLFSGKPSNQISVGLIHLKPNADAIKVQSLLNATLPNDVKVLTPEKFVEIEIDYWASQGTGFIFMLGVVVGFIVGIVIVYQILYSDVSEHLAEYATLKAMGYSDRYLLGVLLQEALLLAVLGFIPGFFLSCGLYQITFAATLLPVTMKINRAINVLLLTIIMCSISGAIAMQKLRSADPADVF